MMIKLEKNIKKGSLRCLGQNYNGLSPQKLVIAGNSIKGISDALNFTSYKIGHFNIENTFIAYDQEKIFYIYVNPSYKNYRKVFETIVGDIPDDYHVDHILARNLAKYFDYKYVVLCMVPNRVNIKHGRIEKNRMPMDLINDIPEICYSDDRIFDKILSRNPEARRLLKEIIRGYNPGKSPSYGLTLKQKGIWNSAFGFDKVNKETLIKKLSIISNA